MCHQLYSCSVRCIKMIQIYLFIYFRRNRLHITAILQRIKLNNLRMYWTSQLRSHTWIPWYYITTHTLMSVSSSSSLLVLWWSVIIFASASFLADLRSSLSLRRVSLRSLRALRACSCCRLSSSTSGDGCVGGGGGVVVVASVTAGELSTLVGVAWGTAPLLDYTHNTVSTLISIYQKQIHQNISTKLVVNYYSHYIIQNKSAWLWHSSRAMMRHLMEKRQQLSYSSFRGTATGCCHCYQR